MTRSAQAIRFAGAGMWRHLGRLPVHRPEHVVSLGEGDTPLLRLSDRLRRATAVGVLLGKAEHRNPTGSYKDRIASVAASLVLERGLGGLIGSSSGNGGTAAAAYGALARRPVALLTRRDIVPAKQLEIRAYGGQLRRVRDFVGDTDAFMTDIASLAADGAWFPFLTCFRHSPDAMAGVKTIAYELAEAAPHATVVYVPVGGGGLLTGVRRGYLDAGGGQPPRMVGVQPEGCATLAQWLQGEGAALRGPVSTSVSGLQVSELVDAVGAGEAIRGSGGHAVTVSDEQIWGAQQMLAADGLLVEPAGAAALAGLLADAANGRVSTDDVAVILLTGAGYKDVTRLQSAAADNPIMEIGWAERTAALTAWGSGHAR